jgi:UDP-N-acetylglucosamine:LPS N-acetylglucosamine transferase
MLRVLPAGTASECLAHNKPLIYVPRTHWNEETYLVGLLTQEGLPLRMEKAHFFEGKWGPYLEEAYRLRHVPRYTGPTNATEVVVDRIEELLREHRAAAKVEAAAAADAAADPIGQLAKGR